MIGMGDSGGPPVSVDAGPEMQGACPWRLRVFRIAVLAVVFPRSIGRCDARRWVWRGGARWLRKGCKGRHWSRCRLGILVPRDEPLQAEPVLRLLCRVAHQPSFTKRRIRRYLMHRATERRGRVSPLKNRGMPPRLSILFFKTTRTSPCSPSSTLLPTCLHLLPLKSHLDIGHFRRIPLRSIPHPQHAAHAIRHATDPTLLRALDPLPDHPDVRARPAMGWYRGRFEPCLKTEDWWLEVRL